MHDSVYPSLFSRVHHSDSGSAISASSVSLFCPCSGSVYRLTSVPSAFIRYDVCCLYLLPRTQLLFTQILKAIWPSIAHLPNHLPANASITTSGMFQLPFTVSTTFICPQECFAILSIGPFSFLSCSSLPRNYDISSWPNQS